MSVRESSARARFQIPLERDRAFFISEFDQCLLKFRIERPLAWQFLRRESRVDTRSQQDSSRRCGPPSRLWRYGGHPSREGWLATRSSLACQASEGWRRRPDLNRGWRFCRQGRDVHLVVSSCFLVGRVPSSSPVFGRNCSQVVPTFRVRLRRPVLNFERWKTFYASTSRAVRTDAAHVPLGREMPA